MAVVEFAATQREQSRSVAAFVFEELRHMARWPDDRKSNLIALVLVFVLFPVLCWLSWRWLTQP